MSGPRKKAKRARPTPPTTLQDEIRRLQKISALLICIQHAANEGVEFDVADALIVVITLVDESLAGIDRLEASS
jgi:hypothetical protein